MIMPWCSAINISLLKLLDGFDGCRMALRCVIYIGLLTTTAHLSLFALSLMTHVLHTKDITQCKSMMVEVAISIH